MKMFIKFLQVAAQSNRLGVAVTRAGLIVVLLWIGGLKVFRYEADGIIPFVASSPFMSFFLNDPGNYQTHKTRKERSFQRIERGTKRTARIVSRMVWAR